MFNDELRTRSFNLSIQVILFLREIADNQESKILKAQLIRSVTSVAANFRAACVSRSKQEWYSKMSIVVEEADEVVFWLELFENLNLIKGNAFAELKSEALELVKIFSKSRGKLTNK
ncbi:MAG: four helix bundle protein [Saprospiraceae bacterium]|jgi:four helix bundle protein